MSAVLKFLAAARSLASQGLSKQAVEKFAKNEFGEINELLQRQIDNIYKPGKGITSIKKDPDFDNTVIQMQIDEFGPFNPRNPLKNLKKQTEGLPSIKKDRPPKDKKADGGRIGLKGGADASKSDFKTPSTTASAPPSMGFGNPPPGAPSGGNGGNNNQTPQKIKIPKTIKDTGNTAGELMFLKNVFELNPYGIMKNIGTKMFLDKLISDADTEEDQNMMLADVSAMDLKRKNQFKNLDYGTAKDIGMINPTMTEQEFEGVKSGEITEPTGQFIGAKGGRVGLKNGMDRRTFLKIMGGLASIPILGKFFKSAKVASKTAPVVSNVTKSEAPAYFFDLVTKIKAFGKQSKVGPSERVNEFSYIGKNGDEYTLTEDIVSGDAQIIKDKMGVGSYGDKTFDTINDRSIMEYKAPKKDADPETKTFIDEGAEYDEYKVEFDMDGTEAGADVIEETIQKEIIEESKKSAPPIKKASGGLAYMLGE